MSSSKDNSTYKKTSFLAGNNSSFIEKFYLDYLENPARLPEDWRLFFEGLNDNQDLISKNLKGPSWSPVKKRKIEIEKDNNNTKQNIIFDVNTEKEKEQSVKAIALIRDTELEDI